MRRVFSHMGAIPAAFALVLALSTSVVAGDHTQIAKGIKPGSIEDIIKQYPPASAPQGTDDTAPTPPPAETQSEFVAHWLADNVPGAEFLHPPKSALANHGTHKEWLANTELILELAERYNGDEVVSGLLGYLTPRLSEVKALQAFDKTAYTDRTHPAMPLIHQVNEALAESLDRLGHIARADPQVASLTAELWPRLRTLSALADFCGFEGQLQASGALQRLTRPNLYRFPVYALGGVLAFGMVGLAFWAIRRHRSGVRASKPA